MTKQRLEAIIGLTIVILACLVYFLVIPVYVEPDDFSTVSPDLLPNVTVICFGLLGGIMFIHRQFIAEFDGEPSPISKENLIQLFIIIVIFAVAIFLMHIGGYLIGGSAVVAALMLYMGARNWLQIAATSLIAPVLLYGLFEVLLGIPLP